MPCCGSCTRPLDRYERAALYVDNAQHGRRPATPTPTSLFAQRLYHNRWYRWCYVLACIANLVQTIWEEPSAVAATSVAAKGALWGADFLFLGFVAFDLYLQALYHGIVVWRGRGWIRAKLGLLVALVLNLCLHIALPFAGLGWSAPYVMRALRPLFLVERLARVRRVAKNIASTVPKILNVLVLLSLHVLFFAVLGFVLFAGIGSEEGGPLNCTPFNGGFSHGWCVLGWGVWWEFVSSRSSCLTPTPPTPFQFRI